MFFILEKVKNISLLNIYIYIYIYSRHVHVIKKLFMIDVSQSAQNHVYTYCTVYAMYIYIPV